MTLTPRAIAARAATAVLLALAAGCAMPLTQSAGRPAPPLGRFPDGAAELERAAEDGVLLRGVHVPAEPARALVLHLLPRGASSAGNPGLAGFREMMGALRASGIASVAVDYRGVGRSGGSLDSTALALDAAVMLELATSAADGAPVVVRAASLGSLAWASAAASAPDPAALIMAAPVDAATLRVNAFRSRHGGLLGALLSWFHADPDVPTLRAALERHAVPTLLLLAEHDPLLPEREREALLASLPDHVEAHVLPMDHEDLVIRSLGFEMGPQGGRVVPELLPQELAFLDRVLGSGAARR